MLRRPNPVVRAAGDGRFELVLEPGLRTALDDLLGQLDELLEVAPDDPSTERLRPPAYLDDDERDAGYQLLAGEELRTRRRESIRAVRESLDREHLGEDDLWAWLRALNALRLVVGTRLGIEDDDHDADVGPDDPDAPLWAVYDLCTWLQHHVITALGG